MEFTQNTCDEEELTATAAAPVPCGVETRVVIDEGGMDDYDCSQVPEAPRTHDTSPACARGKADSGPGVAGDGTRQEVGADEKSSNSEAPVFAVGQAVEVKDWPSDANRAIVKSNENAPFCYLVEHKGMTYTVKEENLTAGGTSLVDDAEDSDTSTMCARRVCEGALPTSLPKENSRGLASGRDARSSGSSAAAEEAPADVHRFALGQRVYVTAWSARYEDAVCTVTNVDNAPDAYVISCDGSTFTFAEEQLYAADESATSNAQAPVHDETMGESEVEDASSPAGVHSSKPEAFVIGQEVVVKIWPSGSNRAVVTSDRDAPFCYVVRYEGTTYPMKGEELAPLLDDAEENHPCESGPSAATEEAEAPAPANADECMEDSEADSAGAKSSNSEAPVFAVGQEVEVKFWPRGANRAVVTSNTNAPFCYVVTHKGTTHSVDGPQLKEVKPPRSSKAQSVSKGKKAKAATKQRAEAPADDEKSSNSEAPVFAVGQAVEVKIWPSNANRGVVTSNESAPYCYLVEHKGKDYTVTEEQLTVVKDSCPSKAKSASKHVKNEASRFEVGQKVRVVGWSPDDVLTVTCNKKYPKYVVTTSAGAQHVKTEDQLARCETESQWTDGEECPEEDAVYRVGQKVKVHRKGWGCEFHKVVGTDRAPAVYRVRHEKTRNKRDVVAAEISTGVLQAGDTAMLSRWGDGACMVEVIGSRPEAGMYSVRICEGARSAPIEASASELLRCTGPVVTTPASAPAPVPRREKARSFPSAAGRELLQSESEGEHETDEEVLLKNQPGELRNARILSSRKKPEKYEVTLSDGQTRTVKGKHVVKRGPPRGLTYAVGSAVKLRTGERAIVVGAEDAPWLHQVEGSTLKARDVEQRDIHHVTDKYPTPCTNYVSGDLVLYKQGGQNRVFRVVGPTPLGGVSGKPVWPPEDTEVEVEARTLDKRCIRRLLDRTHQMDDADSDDELSSLGSPDIVPKGGKREASRAASHRTSRASVGPAYKVGDVVKYKHNGSVQVGRVEVAEQFSYRIRSLQDDRLIRRLNELVSVCEEQIIGRHPQGTKRTLDAPPTTPKRARYEHSESTSDVSDSEPPATMPKKHNAPAARPPSEFVPLYEKSCHDGSKEDRFRNRWFVVPAEAQEGRRLVRVIGDVHAGTFNSRVYETVDKSSILPSTCPAGCPLAVHVIETDVEERIPEAHIVADAEVQVVHERHMRRPDMLHEDHMWYVAPPSPAQRQPVRYAEIQSGDEPTRIAEVVSQKGGVVRVRFLSTDHSSDLPPCTCMLKRHRRLTASSVGEEEVSLESLLPTPVAVVAASQERPLFYHSGKRRVTRGGEQVEVEQREVILQGCPKWRVTPEGRGAFVWPAALIGGTLYYAGAGVKYEVHGKTLLGVVTSFSEESNQSTGLVEKYVKIDLHVQRGETGTTHLVQRPEPAISHKGHPRIIKGMVNIVGYASSDLPAAPSTTYRLHDPCRTPLGLTPAVLREQAWLNSQKN